MKKFIVLIVIVFIFCGCADWEQVKSHTKSGIFGLNRVITLYANDGKILGQWEGNFAVEHDQGTSSARFIYNGKAIEINGTYTIIEK